MKAMRMSHCNGKIGNAHTPRHVTRRQGAIRNHITVSHGSAYTVVSKGGSSVGERGGRGRGAAGAEGVVFGEGCPPPQRGGVWGGGCAPSEENFLNFYPKMAHFCAFCICSSNFGVRECLA